ncbi:SMP-30/gluconolactonase/LRE family protein [Nocardioides sambongensis]|uniref:SMP-30/gluconolactonase/LRE family protein n=1 Tax=Nocardioides sambongensis TaxID=2589074 RepID=UPI00112AAD9C|nr:SMP-30/gluconolactonase/LRE family protein [Nocardioides sambongensis]
MSGQEWRVVAEGFAFPECPRWHRGALWFSDVATGEVVRLDISTGATEVVFSGGRHNAGLGFLPDGDLLIADGTSRRVLRRRADGSVTVHADLTAIATHTLNDMHVDARGHAYVGNYGDDSVPPAPAFPATLALVRPDGSVAAAATELAFPNGVATDPHDTVLYVAETRSTPSRINAFDVAADGSLSGRRTVVELGEGVMADGIAVASDGALWVASPFTDEVVQVDPDGTVVGTVPVPSPYAVAVADDQLLVCSSPTWVPEEALRLREGKVLARRLG